MSESTIDQQFIEYVVKSLVSKPDAVIVERIIDEKGVLLTLTVDPEDLGRVIGKRGATAQSLRTLLRALGTKNEARYNLKIVDNGVPREERQSSRDEKPEESSNDGWSSTPVANSDDDFSSSNDEDSAAQTAADDSGEEDAIARTRRELEDLDDLDV
ncbi:KH domain-containing protein [Candidatus Saccharibacteria bacterium]|nr:KH domain-containing protein [Candidatus Saccharibacteria bacterium]MCA9328353.1 KH domain-containing protein [Candidatus Saccharibacteria bacterium]